MRLMAEMRRSLRGVHNFLPTPFLPDCRPDLDGMRDNVAYHACTGPEDMTVTVCGGFGEGPALDAEEHRDVVAAAVDGAAGQVGIAAVALGGYGMQRTVCRMRSPPVPIKSVPRVRNGDSPPRRLIVSGGRKLWLELGLWRIVEFPFSVDRLGDAMCGVITRSSPIC